MKFYKSFLLITTLYLLSFSEKGLTMEEDLVDPLPLSRTNNFLELPIEVKAHILSFLEQRDLLKAGRTSKNWRKAAEILWKTKPLDLSNRELKQDDYEALVNGPFCYLILQYVGLGTEEVSILAHSSRFICLDLSYNNIGEDGTGKLSAANFPLLTTLNLSYNSIGAGGVGKLATANFPLLTALYFSYNSI